MVASGRVADGVSYDVNAFLRTQGSFEREAMSAARSADVLGSSWGRMSNSMISAGERVRGTFGDLARGLAMGGAASIGGGLVAGIGAAVVQGVRFNDTMEQGALGLATMYQTFGVASGLERNVELAKAFQHELVAIADASPGTTEDMILAYTTAAPALSSVTQDLMRQKDIMGQLSTMAWASHDSYKQMGSDFGRIIKGTAGQETSMFTTLDQPIKAAFEEATGQAAKTGEAWSQQWNKAVQQGGDLGLKIMEKVLATVPKEFAEAYGQSFGGVMASVQSKMTKLAGDFGKPLFDSMREAMVKASGEGGVVSDESMAKLREVAFFSGGLLADAFESGADKLMRAIDYVANNWRQIAESIQKAGVMAGLAIKSAIVIGMTRHFVGSAMIVGGKMAQAFDAAKPAAKAIGEFVAAQMKVAHMSLARGMKGGGTGVLGAAGRGLGAGFGKRMQGKKDPFNAFGRSIDGTVLKVASFAATIGSLGVVSMIVVTAIGAIGVAFAGVGAYFVESWDRISGSIVRGLQDGTITLVPLMTSLYTFWNRLVMVGEALVGGGSAIDTVNGGLSFMTTAIDMVSGALSWFVWGLSIMVGGWAALKLGMLGVMSVIVGIVDLANTMGAVSDDTLARAKKNYQGFSDSVDESFMAADKLAAASEKIASAQLSPLDFTKAEAEANQLQQSLADALSGKTDGAKGGKTDGDKGGNAGRAGKAAVKIDKLVVEVKLDADPDRVFSQFLPRLAAMAERRIQPYETSEVGT